MFVCFVCWFGCLLLLLLLLFVAVAAVAAAIASAAAVALSFFVCVEGSRGSRKTTSQATTQGGCCRCCCCCWCCCCCCCCCCRCCRCCCCCSPKQLLEDGEQPPFERILAPPGDPNEVIDGKTWARQGISEGLPAPDTLRSYATRLSHRMLEGQDISDTERRSWVSWLIRDIDPAAVVGDVSMAGIKHFCLWMGVHDTAVERSLKFNYPCQGTGTHKGTDGRRYTCGRGSWCKNCEAIIEKLGKAWVLPMMTDIIAQTMLLATRAWVGHEANISFWPYETPVHICQEGCEGYRQEDSRQEIHITHAHFQERREGGALEPTGSRTDQGAQLPSWGGPPGTSASSSTDRSRSPPPAPTGSSSRSSR